MTHPDETVVRRFLEAALGRDVETTQTLIADDITWHFAGRNPMSGAYRGRDGFFDFVQTYGRTMAERGVEERLDIHDVVADDRHVVVLWTRTGSRGDDSFTSNGVGVYHVDDGRIRDVWVIHEDQHAFDEFYA